MTQGPGSWRQRWTWLFLGRGLGPSPCDLGRGGLADSPAHPALGAEASSPAARQILSSSLLCIAPLWPLPPPGSQNSFLWLEGCPGLSLLFQGLTDALPGVAASPPSPCLGRALLTQLGCQAQRTVLTQNFRMSQPIDRRRPPK